MEIQKLKFNFNKTDDKSGVSFYDEEAIAGLLIIKSGWTSPQLYHCILEWGEYEDYDHELLTKEDIEKKYKVQI
jgi:hypothetical protein